MSDDAVEVLKDDLLAIRESLNAASCKEQAEDLVTKYRTLNRRTTTSPLTKDLERSIERIDSYLEEAPEEDVQ